MEYDPINYLSDENPRTTIYFPYWPLEDSTDVEHSRIENDFGTHWYILAPENIVPPGLKKIPSNFEYRPRPISDFSVLIDAIELGEKFSNLKAEDLYDEDGYIQRNKEKVDAIVSFVKRNGLPFCDNVLKEMPKAESERLRSLDLETFMNETGAWYPQSGCKTIDIIAATNYLYTLWTLWARLQDIRDDSRWQEERKNVFKMLNGYISQSGCDVSINGIKPFHKTAITHTIQFNEVVGKYRDYYKSNNLFSILLEQLCSFFADYDASKYATLKRCKNEECSRQFIPVNGQKYCPICRKLGKNDLSTARSRKYRALNPEKSEENKINFSIKRKYKDVETGKMSQDEFDVWEESYLEKKGRSRKNTAPGD